VAEESGRVTIFPLFEIQKVLDTAST